jgi:2-oxoglutarate dehydrogenase E1 component
VEELTKGYFQDLIDDDFVDAKKVTRVLLCSGKIYFDLLNKQRADNRKDVAIVRLEQIYPMPHKGLDDVYAKYKDADFVWVQEEPKNMGAWTFMFRYEENRYHLRLLGRKASASPATGHSKVHDKEQEHIVEQAFAPE